MKKILLSGILLCIVIFLAQISLAATPSITDFVSDPLVFNSDTGSALFSYTLNDVDNGQIALEIYDSGNNLIRMIDGGTQSSGQYSITWDGKDSGGLAVSQDNYTAKLIVSFGGGNYEFVLKWGAWYSSSGGLRYPTGMAVDSFDNVYIADACNNRIQKFDPNGNFVSKWGSYGTGDGEFDSPYDIAFDSNGNVYVVDRGNHRIQKFDPNGNFVIKWGSYGSGNSQFNTPAFIALDSSDNVYVTDMYNHRVQKFDPNGNFVTKWGKYGMADGQFRFPTGITIDSNDNIYVAGSSSNRIQKFNSNGIYIRKWGGLRNPFGMATDANNNIYVADKAHHLIKKFNSDGTYITQWGGLGTGDGEFRYPMGVAIDSDGNAYVADTFHHRIQKFTQPITSISTETNLVVDNTLPQTIVSLSGIQGTNDWYVSDVEVTLTASDNYGVEITKYSFDNINWNVYELPLTVGNEGEIIVYYYSIDEAGNIEEMQSEIFKIDKIAPEIVIMSPTAIEYEHSEIIDIDFTAVDNVSGINNTIVYLDGEEYIDNTIDLLYLLLGTHNLRVESKNNAGLKEVSSVEFEVIATIDSLSLIIERFYEAGEIDNKGIMNSINKKLELAKRKINSNDNKVARNILDAFINEIEAQDGKHISGFIVGVLRADVEYIISDD